MINTLFIEKLICIVETKHVLSLAMVLNHIEDL